MALPHEKYVVTLAALCALVIFATGCSRVGDKKNADVEASASNVSSSSVSESNKDAGRDDDHKTDNENNSLFDASSALGETTERFAKIFGDDEEDEESLQSIFRWSTRIRVVNIPKIALSLPRH